MKVVAMHGLVEHLHLVWVVAPEDWSKVRAASRMHVCVAGYTIHTIAGDHTGSEWDDD